MNTDIVSYDIYLKPRSPIKGTWYLWGNEEKRSKAAKVAKELSERSSVRVVMKTERIMPQYSYVAQE